MFLITSTTLRAIDNAISEAVKSINIIFVNVLLSHIVPNHLLFNNLRKLIIILRFGLSLILYLRVLVTLFNLIVFVYHGVHLHDELLFLGLLKSLQSLTCFLGELVQLAEVFDALIKIKRIRGSNCRCLQVSHGIQKWALNRSIWERFLEYFGSIQASIIIEALINIGNLFR